MSLCNSARHTRASNLTFASRARAFFRVRGVITLSSHSRSDIGSGTFALSASSTSSRFAAFAAPSCAAAPYTRRTARAILPMLAGSPRSASRSFGQSSGSISTPLCALHTALCDPLATSIRRQRDNTPHTFVLGRQSVLVPETRISWDRARRDARASSRPPVLLPIQWVPPLGLPLYSLQQMSHDLHSMFRGDET